MKLIISSALLASCMSFSVSADNKATPEEKQPEVKPDFAFLLYLAELEEVDGELVGAIDMQPVLQPQDTTSESSQVVNRDKEPKIKDDKLEGQKDE